MGAEVTKCTSGDLEGEITGLVSAAILTASTKTVGFDLALNASTFSLLDFTLFAGFVLAGFDL